MAADYADCGCPAYEDTGYQYLSNVWPVGGFCEQHCHAGYDRSCSCDVQPYDEGPAPQIKNRFVFPGEMNVMQGPL